MDRRFVMVKADENIVLIGVPTDNIQLIGTAEKCEARSGHLRIYRQTAVQVDVVRKAIAEFINKQSFVR